MTLFKSLGFSWDHSAIPDAVPTHSLDRVTFRFQRMLPEYVWDAGVLEGNPFTFPEVQTLLGGVTVGGRKLSDQDQILNLAESTKHLLHMLRLEAFSLSKPVFTELHSIVARREALEWGVFRGEGDETYYTPDVALGEHGHYTPLPTRKGAGPLNEVFSKGTKALEQCPAFERATAFFLFVALQQFYFDGNKRTSRLMMNGVLMSNGIDSISVPAAKAQEFNEKMVRFYLSKDATEMMDFLVQCHPESDRMNAASPERGQSENEHRLEGDDSEPGIS